MRTVAAAVTLALAQLVSAQSGAYGQCGGTGWGGATTCVSGYTCTFSNPYYSQCLPGSAPSSSSSATSSSSSSSSVSSISSSSTPGSTVTPTKTTSSSTPTGTGGSCPAPSKTLTSTTLWQRVDEAPYFHYYVQSAVLNQPGPAVVSSYTTAMQGNIVNGQWVQYSTCGTTLYATVLPPAAGTTRLQVYFQTTPATNVTWSFSGDAVDAVIPGYKQQSSGNFYLCTTAAGGGGTSAAPYLYVNTGAFDYGTPTGCADGTVNYYNGATAVP